VPVARDRSRHQRSQAAKQKKYVRKIFEIAMDEIMN